MLEDISCNAVNSYMVLFVKEAEYIFQIWTEYLISSLGIIIIWFTKEISIYSSKVLSTYKKKY